MNAAARAAPPPARGRPSFLGRGARALAIAALIAGAVALLFGQRPLETLVYALSITLGCWFFIDGGRLLAARWVNRRLPADAPGRDRWPGWPWMTAVLLAGTVLGAAVGLALAELVLGAAAAGAGPRRPRELLALLVVSLVPGVVATLVARNRERLAATEARAQQSQREAAEHQLRLLEAQLEPHMLFNTLANLRALIGADPARAQAMLDRLIDFLRATLSASRVGLHPLAAEFSRLADYLALMQVRMGERLQVRLDLPEALAGVAVPPLLLQPLVENAVKHGLEPKVDGGRVEAVARRDGDALVVVVRDTGVGLGARADAAPGFGLQQVRERLATLYGAAASLTLAPAGDAEGGACATVRLPMDRGRVR